MQVHWQPGITLFDVEKMVVQAAMTYYRGNKAHVSQALGVARATLNSMIERHNIAIDPKWKDTRDGNNSQSNL